MSDSTNRRRLLESLATLGTIYLAGCTDALTPDYEEDDDRVEIPDDASTPIPETDQETDTPDEETPEQQGNPRDRNYSLDKVMRPHREHRKRAADKLKIDEVIEKVRNGEDVETVAGETPIRPGEPRHDLDGEKARDLDINDEEEFEEVLIDLAHTGYGIAAEELPREFEHTSSDSRTVGKFMEEFVDRMYDLNSASSIEGTETSTGEAHAVLYFNVEGLGTYMLDGNETEAIEAGWFDPAEDIADRKNRLEALHAKAGRRRDFGSPERRIGTVAPDSVDDLVEWIEEDPDRMHDLTPYIGVVAHETSHNYEEWSNGNALLLNFDSPDELYQMVTGEDNWKDVRDHALESIDARPVDDYYGPGPWDKYD